MIVTLIRTVILYLLIIVGIRLLGKRQIGELEPTELVLALIIADLASVPMQDNGIPLLAGVIPIITLLCVAMIISVLTVHSIRLRALFCGRPSILVENGKIQQQELRKNRFTVDELMEELRTKGCADLSAIKYAVLETNGNLSVLLNARSQPLTAAQFGLDPQDGGLPLILISDGRLIERSLNQSGYDRDWLQKQLESHGAAEIAQVFLFTVNEVGKTYFIPREETG